MNIYDIQISFGLELSNTITLNIYLSGCIDNKKCDRTHCHNPALHDFNVGGSYELWEKNISSYLSSKLIEGIILIGGEPFDQQLEDLKLFLKFLSSFNKPIFAYTGYFYNDIPLPMQQLFHFFKSIYAGPYIPDQPEIQTWVNPSKQ